MFKRCLLLLLTPGIFFAVSPGFAQNAAVKTTCADLSVTVGKTNCFSLTCTLETDGQARIKLIGGEICAVEPEVEISSDSGSLWTANPEARLYHYDNAYYLDCPAQGKYTVKLNFVCKIYRDALKRQCSFYLLPALVRKLTLNLSPQDIEPVIKDCVSLTAGKNRLHYSGTLEAAGDFSMEWKKLIDDKTAAPAVNAEIFTIGSVLTGTVKVNTRILYKIFQGKLKHLRLRVPKGLNVLAIKGKDIRTWNLDPENPQALTVELNNEKDDNYALEIQAEKILGDTPCSFSLQPLIPENVMRLDGALRLGSGRGVKLLTEKSFGLVQVDNNSFSRKTLPEYDFAVLNPQSYNFSGNDYLLQAKAENIRPAFSAQLNCVAACGSRALQVQLNCTLKIKDAPLRELILQYEPGLNFSRVYGRYINPQDYDLFTENGAKKVKITFNRPVFGELAFSVCFERELKAQDAFSIPGFTVIGAKSVRGYLMLTAERGLELLPQKLKNLIPVHPASLPLRQKNLQYAYLFRNQDWSGNVKIKHVKGNIAAEIFNLISAGDGTAYGSSIMSF
ncbi:MAG: hypothetical protein PHV59_05520, partial [Victivallales bacterium]|nr:hypothetical protein [Victivallales bacterium]